MCVVSNIGDHYRDPNGWPWSPVNPIPPSKVVPEDFAEIWRKHLEDQARRNMDDTVEALRKRVEALEELLRKGKEYDAETGQPDCELDEKKQALKKLAEQLGVEIEFPN